MKNIILLSLIFTISNSYGQDFEWVKSFSPGSQIYDITTDANGNVYSVGSFTGTCDLDPNSGVVNAISNGGSDIFITKHASDGSLVWAKNGGGIGNEIPFNIEVNSNGECFITGIYRNTVDFDFGTGTANFVSNGLDDIFILKIDASGNYSWAKSIGGAGSDRSVKILLKTNGEILITGHFLNTVDFDPDGGIQDVTASGGQDIFLLTLDTTGGIVDIRTIGGTGNDTCHGSIIDVSGNIYISGMFFGSIDFDPGSGVSSYSNTSGFGNSFIVKLDSNLDLIWYKVLESTGPGIATSIAINSNNKIGVSGIFSGTIDADPSVSTNLLNSIGASYDGYVVQLDQNGNFEWSSQITSLTEIYFYDAEYDSNNNLFITGYHQGVDVYNQSGTQTLNTNGQRDFLLLEYNSSGSLQTSYSFGGAFNDNSYATHIDNSNSIFISGSFQSNIDFDPGSGIANSSPIGGFILKFSQCNPTTSSQTQSSCDSYTWPLNSSTYNASGTYTHILPNAAGCDSIVTLNLTINNSTSGSENITACDFYTWSANATNYTTSGTYTATLTNAVGCDSIATLNLTINNSSTSSTTLTECDSYVWNGTTYNTSGVYTWTTTNAVGCDSIATLNLTINNSSASSTTVTECDSYTWSANATNYISSGVYTATLTNAAGCDSVVTLNLTINSSFNQSENISICNNATYTLPNGSVVNSNGTYYSNLTSVNGCDSIIETVLNVISPNITTSLSGITITANAFTANYQWLDCNSNFQIIPGESASDFTPIMNGSYAVEIFENGCVDTSDCVLIENVNLNELEYDWFEIYPNPTTSSVTLFSKNGIGSMLIIQDPQGKIVDRIQINSPSTIIDLTKYQKGTYFMLIENKGVFKKLIVQ